MKCATIFEKTLITHCSTLISRQTREQEPIIDEANRKSQYWKGMGERGDRVKCQKSSGKGTQTSSRRLIEC